MSGVVIIGAGLGGLRVAESLRSRGYTGQVTIVGDEIHLPYNRPPLSKEALAGGVEVSELEFRRKPHVSDVIWKLGSPAVTSSINEGTVTLADGTKLNFDALAVASGIRPRRLPIPGPQEGRVVLRTAEDARRLRAELVPGAKVLIMGAGFIGCEVAATARKLGCEVNIVALDAEPMIRPLGVELGAGMRRRHEANGVQFHLGRTVTSFNGNERVESATLDDGTVLAADLVVEAVGSAANVEWLDGNGLDLTDGLEVDDAMIVAGTTNVVAVGDIARHPNVLFSGPKRRIEHWNMPTETGKRAGQTLAELLAGESVSDAPFSAMPSFWSDQYSYKIQSFGMPGNATRIQIVDGMPDEPCIAEYFDESGLVGVIGIDKTAELAPYRKLLMERG